MGYIAFASAKGSPGVTTTVAALAAAWPADRALTVVEVDPSGGDLVVRLDLATEPGLVSLAAAGRRELAPGTLLDHTQDLSGLAGAVASEGGLRRSRRVLVGPVSADQAAAALTALRGALPSTLGTLDGDVLVDCGRLEPHSPAFEVATKADLLVMVAQPVVAEVHHLAARLASVGSATAVSVLLVGDRPYSVNDVAEAVGANPLGTLPVDGRTAAALGAGAPGSARSLRRSPLLREAGAVAEGLAEWLGPIADDSAAPVAPPVSPPSSVPSSSVPPGPNTPPAAPPVPPAAPPSPSAAPPVGPAPPGPPPPSAPPGPPAPPGPSAPPVGVAAGPEQASDGFGRLRSNVRRERPPAAPAKHFRRDGDEERRR